ncbi:hypothetical protein POM88_048914 [Heracleum sosnowskyi]|uniref:Uncharacterized protein n=1 Tax=Heracleum sosnowskyi TaxID=360622 RepID=A0AAD8GW42_9APIA|nr:hypothetical protein POM88_048914 [Heracleum sosnowskyi]
MPRKRGRPKLLLTKEMVEEQKLLKHLCKILAETYKVYLYGRVSFWGGRNRRFDEELGSSDGGGANFAGLREQSTSPKRNSDQTLNRVVVVHDFPSRIYGLILEDLPANWNQALALVEDGTLQQISIVCDLQVDYTCADGFFTPPS